MPSLKERCNLFLYKQLQKYWQHERGDRRTPATQRTAAGELALHRPERPQPRIAADSVGDIQHLAVVAKETR